MKVKHFFGLAVLAAMTASCSSNDELVNNGGGTGALEGRVGYATFSINLPSTSSGITRAGDANPEFNEGTVKEYDVNDATIVIFKKDGSSEEAYKFVESAKMGDMAPWIKVGSDGVTTGAQVTVKLNSVDLTGSEYYALVLLNNQDKNGDVKVILPKTNDTYGGWNVAEKANVGKFADNTKGFYMANAPQFTAAGTEPTTLVKIDKIYSTEADAANSTGTTVYVERGLAKVSVASLPTGKTPTGTKYNQDKVDIEAWNLDVTNTKSFPVHKTSGLATDFDGIWKNESSTTGPNTARFVDGSNATFKRVYWGVDPNYSDDYSTIDACNSEFTTLKSNNVDVTGTADAPQYCLENTFDINHMLQGQTTRVVFKATYTPNGFSKGDNFYKIGNSSDLWSEDGLKKQIVGKAQEVLSENDETKIEVDLSAAANNIKGEAGTKVLAQTNVKHNGTEVSADDIAKINAKLGLSTTEGTGIATYLSGVSYYIARVKHFGEALTPWSAGDPTYNSNNAKYLGRYGVLRNNWYELTVNSVSGPGTPEIPEVKPTIPDDEDDKYISVSVKILDWAKRSQTVDL